MEQQLQTQKTANPKEELLRVLTKGMITIPKTWRDDFGFNQGDRVRAIKTAYQIIIEPLEQPVPYRIYTQKELKQFLKDDTLSPRLQDQIKKNLSNNA